MTAFLSWLNSVQDWVSRSERSSGFRPLLVLIPICLGGAWLVCTVVPTLAVLAVCTLVVAPVSVFLVVYVVKAFKDPGFCRSELHVERGGK